MLQLSVSEPGSENLEDVQQVDSRSMALIGQVQAAIHAAFPSAIFTIGTISYGDGDGALTVSIQGEYVQTVRGKFPGLAVYPLSQAGYQEIAERQGVTEKAA